MKRIITVLCLISVIGLCAEEDDFSFRPGLPGWTKNNRTVSFDPTVKISDPGSLKLTGKGSVSRKFQLEPDAEYEVSVYIKAKDVTGGKYKGVLLRLTDGDKFYGVSGDPKNLPRQGSFDWTKCTRTIKSSAFSQNTITVMPALTCDGTVWFDDLKIVKKSKAVAPAPAKPVQVQAAAPDMFDFSFKRGLPGWQKNNRTVSFDPNVKISETGSLKLTGQSSVSRRIRLEPDAEYEISVYIKAENVTGGKFRGVLLRLTDGNKYFAVTGDPKNLPRQGSFDWTKCTRTVKSSFFGKSEITVMPVLTCDGTAWFDDLRIEKKKITPQGENVFRRQYSKAVAQVGLIPEGVFGFFDPGQEVSFRVLIESSAKNLEYELTVKDESGREVCRIPRKKLDKTFRIPGQKAGYYVVDADIFADGKKAYFIQSAFAVNVPVKKQDPFFQFSYGALPEMIPGLKRIGGGSIVLKNGVLQHPSVLKIPPEELAERFVKAQKPFLDDPDFDLTIGIGCSIQSGFRSEAEFKAGWPLMSDPMLKHLVDYVKLVHKLTRNRVREWVIGCEIPSNATGGSKKTLCATWTEAMFNLMVRARMVSRILKAADPKIRIIVGGNNRQEFTNTVERIVMGDLVNDFDEYCIDAYTGNWNMILGQHTIPELKLMDFYKEASELSASLGKGKVIRNDETGYAINYGARFDRGLAVEQAYLTARTIIITRFAPVSRFELHKPADKQWFESSRQDNSICMTTCWKPFRFGKGKNFYHIPLPGGAVYAAAAAELSYAKSLAEVKNGNLYSYLFQKPDGSVLVTLWNIAEEQRFVCDFPTDASAVNMYGRTITVKNLTVGKAPVYITMKMPPAQAVELMKKAVLNNTPEFRCAATDEQVSILSYASETRVCSLQLPGQTAIKVKLLPGKMNVVKAKVTGSGKLIAPDGREYAVLLEKADHYTIPRIKSRPVFDGSGKWLKGLPAGLLKYPENIRPAEALQPERRYFKTSFNPEGHNISAQFWTAYDEENFYLAVKVDDPVHQQRQTAGNLWKDDSIQLVLSHEVAGSSLTAAGQKPRSDYNYGLALTPHGTMLVKYLGKDRGIKKYPARVTRTGNTTFYEVAIPWKAIGGKAKRFGFVVINNDWKTMAAAPYHLDFTEGICGGRDDTKLKVLKYAE